VGTIGHTSNTLIPTISDALEFLKTLKVQPTKVVNSGGGLHAYYYLDNPKVVREKNQVTEFEKLNKKLSNAAQKMASLKGWHIDDIHNLDRVLRVPYSYNCKSDDFRLVDVLFDNGPRYTYEQFISILDYSGLQPQNGVYTVLEVDNIRAELLKARDDQHKSPNDLNGREPLYKLLHLVAKGEAFATVERDNAMQRVCSKLGNKYLNTDPNTLLAVLKPSLAKMAELAPCELDIYVNALDKIKRAQARAKEFFENLAGGDNNTPTQAPPSKPPNNPDEWIVQKGDTHFVWDHGAYARRGYQTIELSHVLRDCFKGTSVAMVKVNSKGNTVQKTTKEIVDEYGTTAYSVISDLSIKESYYDAKSQIYYEAVCPIVEIKPAYHKEIDEWLQLLGGTNASKLLDWIACVTRLDYQCCALYLSDEPGSGKSLLAHGLARLWGDKTPTPISTMLGDFNEAIITCPLLFADEHLEPKFRGQSVTSYLRSLIGTTSRNLTRKYVTPTTLKGAVRVIIAANNQTVLHLGDEDLTRDDLSAISQRFLHIACSQAPRDYLESIGGRSVTNKWIVEGKIAAHALWLKDNRQIVEGKRFLVEGSISEMHRTLATQGKAGMACEWIVRHLSESKADIKNEKLKPKVYGGEFLVNVSCMLMYWDLYLDGIRKPMASKLTQAIGNISKGFRQYGEDQYHIIDKELILNWAERNNVGNPYRVRERLLNPKANDGLFVVMNEEITEK
jgi:hypothetical protein